MTSENKNLLEEGDNHSVYLDIEQMDVYGWPLYTPPNLNLPIPLAPQQQAIGTQPRTLFDGPMTALIKVQIVFLLESLVNAIIDFVSGNVISTGFVVKLFLILVTSLLIGTLLCIAYIDIDESSNLFHFKHLSFGPFCIGLSYTTSWSCC